MKHAIEKAIEALEPLSDDDRMLAVRLAGRSTAAPKKAKRKYTKRKLTGLAEDGGPVESNETAEAAAKKHPERLQSGGKSAKQKKSAPLTSLGEKLRGVKKARPLRSAGSGESE